MTRSSSISGFSTPFSLDPLLAVKLRDVGSCLSPSLSLSLSLSLPHSLLPFDVGQLEHQGLKLLSERKG